MRKTSLFRLLPLLLPALFSTRQADAQGPDSLILNYLTPAQYTVGGVNITGLQRYDKNIVLHLSGLSVGSKVDVPGEKLSGSIEYLWRQNIFSAISLLADSVIGNTIYLRYVVTEIPYQAGPVQLGGISRAEANKLDGLLKAYTYTPVSKQHTTLVQNTILTYFKDKGYHGATVNFSQQPFKADTNRVVLTAHVNKGQRVKINKISITGNANLSDARLRRGMRNTKEHRWYGILKPSKFDAQKYKDDKAALLDAYADNGYRDATILSDTVYYISPNRLNIDISVEENRVYYFGNISWLGNTKYSTDTLNRVLGIKKGDVYNKRKLEEALYMNATGTDVSSLYMDNGHLFFNIIPVETGINGDSVNLELRIDENHPAIINNIVLKGNTRTNDHIILRELYTKPGNLFKRSDLILSRQALARLGYFDMEKLDIKPIPNPQTGTVDIEFIVEEKPTDQFTLSGGIAAGRLVGTVGITMNNFSFRNMFKKDRWRPLPAGDGQIVSLRAQTNGPAFQSYNLSVTEPWLGGRKPNALTGSVVYNAQNYSNSYFKALGFSMGLGTRWKKPDNFFSSFYSLNFFNYNVHNFPSVAIQGNAYNFNLGLGITRNSADASDYPEFGSTISLSLQATPPWSLQLKNGAGFRDYTNSPTPPWVEYHKWKLDLNWYHKLAGRLVLNLCAHAGYLGHYNSSIGTPLVERFYLGGVQIANANFVGQDYVNLRGYTNSSLSPQTGSALYNRFVVEMRYPLIQKQAAGTTVYALAFAEGGNAWGGLSTYNPYNLKRSAGFGIRAILPMFGMVGLDVGYGFDAKTIPGYGASPWQLHFIIGGVP